MESNNNSSTNVETEIDTRAKDKKLYTVFDQEEIGTYLRLCLQVKVRTDNLNQGDQLSPKEFAILYKRFVYFAQDLIQQSQPSMTTLSLDIKKKLELIQREIGAANISYNEQISKIKGTSIVNPSQQVDLIASAKNPFSYQYNPKAINSISSSQPSSNHSSNSLVYPAVTGGILAAGAIGGGIAVVGQGGSAAISTGLSQVGAMNSGQALYPSFNSTNLLQRGSTVATNISRNPTTNLQYPSASVQQAPTNYFSTYNQSYPNPAAYNQNFSQTQQFNANSFQQPQAYNYQPHPQPQTQYYQQPNGYYQQQPQPQQQYYQQSQNGFYQVQQQPQQQPLQRPQSAIVNPQPTQQLQPQPIMNTPINTNSINTQPQVQSAANQVKNLNGVGQLRTIYCPYEIVEAFIKIAKANTDRKVETCAILAGSERNNSLIIDTLIIPTQEGHTDHCYMTDEIQLFEAQINYKVMTLGWIHTHPQFSLFLSSVDLHNQMGYQLQMPEAVAIVYSPIERDIYKAFKVKDSRISEIQKCKRSGFHEHKDADGNPAYEVCQHIKYIKANDYGIKVQTLDLR